MFIRMAIYLVLTLVYTMVLGGTQQATGLLANQVILPQLAPGLAALTMLIVARKNAPSLSLSIKPLWSRAALLAVLIPAGAALLIFVVVTPALRLLDVASISLANAPVSLIGMIIGAVGEELGWRGYLNKLLDGKLAGWLSALIVGIPWALWHMGLYQYGPLYMFFAVILITSYSFVLYFLVQKSGFNVWIAAVFHFMINLTNVVFLTVMPQVNFMMISAIIWAGVAATIVATNRELFFKPHAEISGKVALP